MKNVLIRSETLAHRVICHACVLQVSDYVEYAPFRAYVIAMREWCDLRYPYRDYRYTVDVHFSDTPFGRVIFAFRHPDDALEFKLRWG